MGPTMLMFDCLKQKIGCSCSIKHELPSDRLSLTTSAVEYEASFDSTIIASKKYIQNMISCVIKESEKFQGVNISKRIALNDLF